MYNTYFGRLLPSLILHSYRHLWRTDLDRQSLLLCRDKRCDESLQRGKFNENCLTEGSQIESLELVWPIFAKMQVVSILKIMFPSTIIVVVVFNVCGWAAPTRQTPVSVS